MHTNKTDRDEIMFELAFGDKGYSKETEAVIKDYYADELGAKSLSIGEVEHMDKEFQVCADLFRSKGNIEKAEMYERAAVEISGADHTERLIGYFILEEGIR